MLRIDNEIENYYKLSVSQEMMSDIKVGLCWLMAEHLRLKFLTTIVFNKFRCHTRDWK